MKTGSFSACLPQRRESSFPRLRREWKESVCSVFLQSLCTKDIISQSSLALTFQEVARPFPLVCHHIIPTAASSLQGFPEQLFVSYKALSGAGGMNFCPWAAALGHEGYCWRSLQKNPLSLRVAHSCLVRVGIAFHLQSEPLY